MSRILIVDDIPFIRSVIKDVVVSSGFRVVGEASDGAECVALYKALKPDVVLLDIMMPVMNGLEALKKIKQINKESVVIMCSSLGDQERIIGAIQAGAADFIVKPFRKERIVSAIRRAVK